jgi:hypothetical protein
LPSSRYGKQGVPAALRSDREVRNYRKRLHQRGLSRLEGLGLAGDRKLIRSLARRLAEDSPESKRLRATVGRTLAEEAPRRGGIYAALRRSPLAEVGIKVKRETSAGRKVDL